MTAHLDSGNDQNRNEPMQRKKWGKNDHLMSSKYAPNEAQNACNRKGLDQQLLWTTKCFNAGPQAAFGVF